jgi:hypothetical protein
MNGTSEDAAEGRTVSNSHGTDISAQLLDFGISFVGQPTLPVLVTDTDVFIVPATAQLLRGGLIHRGGEVSGPAD